MTKEMMYSSGRAKKKDGEMKFLPPSSVCGLSEEEVEYSRKKYGKNAMTRQKKQSFFSRLISNLNDPITKILIGALVLNTAFTFSNINWAESIGIALTVVISSLVTTVSEYSSGVSLEKFYSELGEGEVQVLRGGESVSCAVSDIVRFDIVTLVAGESVPADGIVIDGEIECDESALTGESKKVKKSPDSKLTAKLRSGEEVKLTPADRSAVFKSSKVMSGTATMLVTAVGDNTVYGSIAGELSDTDGVSPLKERLGQLAKTISKIGYASAAVVALVHLADAFWFDAGCSPDIALARILDFRYSVPELIHAFTVAISVIVVAVPEGLPMMITVVLSSNMKKMLRSGVFVRRLVGIETAGSIDILFTDKTGTLTTGRLAVSSVQTADGEYFTRSEIPKKLLTVLKNSALCCSSSANATEAAINSYLGITKAPRRDPKTQLPFDSARKYAAGEENGITYIRGAVEYILPYCTSYTDTSGNKSPLTEAVREKAENSIHAATSRSFRVIAAAHTDKASPEELKNSSPASLSSLTFDALFIIKDEIRKEAIPAVEKCKTAGIDVIMITGDNSETAATIARECSILSPEYEVLSGEVSEFAKLSQSNCDIVIDGRALPAISDEQLEALLPRVKVISRVTPTDKSRLVRIAKSGGHTVGMTGDGINDAPALKSADVGFAMGSGTDIAREAGDIVITDDNFVSITNAVLYGRTIFSSIRKFITFQLTMNLAAVGVSILGTALKIESPVTVIQMLWVNIIMDTLGSLAFAGEPALREYMNNPPIKRHEKILTRQMIFSILITAAYSIAMSLFFLLSPSVRYFLGGDELSHLTRFFALFIFMGISIAFCTRTVRINIFASLTKNKAFTVIMPAVAAVQLLIIYFGGEMFRCVPLLPRELFFCALFAITVIPADTVRKCIFALRREKKKKSSEKAPQHS